MEETNTWPQFVYTAHSSLPLLCIYVHSSFWVSVETPFICLWTYCVLSHGSLILPQFPTYRSCLRFPFSLPTPSFSLFLSPSFLLFLPPKSHPSNPTASAIILYKDASQIYTCSISRCLLGISIWKSFLHSKLTCPKLNSLIPH